MYEVIKTIWCTGDEKEEWEEEAEKLNCGIIWRLDGYSLNPPYSMWQGTMIQPVDEDDEDDENDEDDEDDENDEDDEE